ncbi:SGNH/GDSL hydrolase family protein [Aquabacter cavernae]|uniref:SGNH/GDSL hydrolase family protein n=1 Tax=Aquabacter cavernae TaxID=2496029 RepID=UPI000F8DABB7|nr:SGNH/GDSL hydrolase family protein [Aquabacter cavernae]
MPKRLLTFGGNVLVFVLAMLAALVFAEFAVRLIMPQKLTGSSRVQDESGLLMNKASGETLHQFGDVSVTYNFGPLHNRLLAHPVPDSAGKPRVLVLGDSFTFGWLTPTGSTYVDKLQAGFPNDQFINGAAAGWGTADYVRYVESYCASIKPRLILVFLNTDDIGRAYKSGLYSYQDGTLKSEVVGIDPLKKRLNDLPFYNFVSEHSHLLALVKAQFYLHQPQRDISGREFPHLDISSTDNLKAAVGKGEALFLRLKSATAACGAQLAVIYTGWVDYADPSGDREPTMNFLRGAKDFFATNGIAFYDLAQDPALRKVWADRSAYIIPGDWHPNQRGVDAIYQGTVDALGGSVLQK